MSQTREKLEQMGIKILDLTRTELILSMRFLSPALNSLGFKMDLATPTVGTDAAYIRFNPGFLMQVYIEKPHRDNRTENRERLDQEGRRPLLEFPALIERRRRDNRRRDNVQENHIEDFPSGSHSSS